MLPGAKDKPEDLIAQGFVRALRARHLPVDAIVADADMDYYIEHRVIERLSADIIAPARAAGYGRIWLMGISLGGLGCVVYAREHPGEIEGLVLLAPFLGNRGLIVDVKRAGGFAAWQPGEISADDDERRLLAWLKSYRAGDASLPRIYLGYGADDRFAPASEMLAERLPARQVISILGGHDWVTWSALWERLLDRDLFSLGESVSQVAGP
jgi:pimeloyl-ACP methyl ester carboxylesterase